MTILATWVTLREVESFANLRRVTVGSVKDGQR